MLLVSPATICSCCDTKVPIHGVGGLRSLPRNSRTPCFYSGYNGSNKGFLSMCVGKSTPLYETGLHNLRESTPIRYPLALVDDSQYLETSKSMVIGNSAATESAASFDGVPVDPSRLSDSIKADSLSVAQNYLNGKLESISLSVKATLGDANKAVDNVIHDTVLFFNKSGESAGNKLLGLTTGIKEASGGAKAAAVDLLRGAIVFVEASLEQGGKAAISSYSYAKQLLPQEFQDVIRSSEENVEKVLHPVGTSLQQVYAALEGVEKSFGLDPNDPLIHLLLFFGLSVTFWGAYRVLVYGGYSGDLSPESVFELLQGNENAVLIDIRSEELRERDGIPDLRRKARGRYSSVTQPEVNDSVRNLLKGGRELEDMLLAAVIRNLKIADDNSKVLVLDSDGSRSKGVARSLRKLGTKKTYLVVGGFRSWVDDGLRIKMLKPETLLTVLNEETEAIIEEIKPTPLKLVGYGLIALTAAYSLLEWEKTLQLVGIIGLSQSIYRRIASYEDAEDLKQDLSLLLAPVKLGVDAVFRAAGGVENGGNGLPTSPSSSDVQSRVLQAAAKHESQPEGSQDASPSNEKVNVSEA